MSGATGFGEADVDPTPVNFTDRTRHQPVSLEPADDAREGALAEVRGACQLLHTVRLSPVLDQALQHLELTDPKPMTLAELPLQSAPGSCVPAEELPPGCRQRAILLLV